MDTQPPFRFLIAPIHVNYLRPTPKGVPLETRCWVKEIKDRKVVVSSTVSANGETCARGEVVTAQVSDHLATLDHT